MYDGVGGDAITIESMRSLRFGGRLLIVGWAATPNVGASGSANDGAKKNNTPNRVPTNLMMMKGLTVMGCPAMISLRHNPSLHSQRVKDLTAWMLSGDLPPPIVSTVFSPADHGGDLLVTVQKAMAQRADSGSSVGSTVVELVPGSATMSAAEMMRRGTHRQSKL